MPTTLSYALGIVLSSFFSTPAHVFYLPILLIFSLALVSYYFRQTIIVFFLLCMTFFFFGFVQAERDEAPIYESTHITRIVLEKQEAVIVGKLARMVLKNGGGCQAQIDVDFLGSEHLDQFLPTTGRILLTLLDTWPKTIAPGDSLILKATLQPPAVSNTPGTFNYRKYLSRKNVYLIGTVRSAILIQPIDDLPAHFIKKIRYKIEQLRTLIGYKIEQSLPPQSAALYKALLIGDRSGIEPTLLEAFKASGVFHILAISGLHLSLLALCLYTVFFWLLRRSEFLILRCNVRKSAMILSILPLMFYTLLAGAQPPVMRSFIMTLFIIIAIGTDRLRSPLTTISGAALLILLVDPTTLETASFQLSFTAVAAIIIITPVIFKLFENPQSGLKLQPVRKQVGLFFLSITAVTIAATLGTVPLLLHHFHRISLVTLPAILIIEPLICFWSLPLGFLSIFLLFISPDFADITLRLGSYGLNVS